MKKIDEIGLKLCKIQAEVFSASVKETNCSSPIFMRRFMNSQVAQRMDLGGFLFEACDVSQIFQEIEMEFGESSYGKEKYSEAELYWIGYLYRYWSCTYQKTRSEEHTSELQSRFDLVCRLLLEKKKKKHERQQKNHTQ